MLFANSAISVSGTKRVNDMKGKETTYIKQSEDQYAKRKEEKMISDISVRTDQRKHNLLM